MSCRCCALTAALPSRSSSGMLLGMGWKTFYKSKVSRLGFVLSMFWLACSFAKVVLSPEAFGMVWTTFYRSLVIRLGHVLSMFWRACCFANVFLPRHAFGNGLDDFLQVLGEQPGPCSANVLACLQLCPGGPSGLELEVSFLNWKGWIYDCTIV